MTYEPGEGPITEEEAKAAVEADEAADDDAEPPEEPVETGMPPEALAEAPDTDYRDQFDVDGISMEQVLQPREPETEEEAG